MRALIWSVEISLNPGLGLHWLFRECVRAPCEPPKQGAGGIHWNLSGTVQAGQPDSFAWISGVVTCPYVQRSEMSVPRASQKVTYGRKQHLNDFCCVGRPLRVNSENFWEMYIRPDCRERTWAQDS